MSKYTDEEVNKIIADFMGRALTILHGSVIGIVGIGDLYTESLDALVPVWERLDLAYVHLSKGSAPLWEAIISKKLVNSEESSKLTTIQQSAAHATALVIEELNKLRGNE